MEKPNLYIIAGCNGEGKTTASFNVLPSVLDCREFVNADEIAKGLSPFAPETVAIQAGKLFTNIRYYMSEKEINERSRILDEALKESFFKMLELKKKLGQAIVTSNGNGQTVQISAEEAERLASIHAN